MVAYRGYNTKVGTEFNILFTSLREYWKELMDEHNIQDSDSELYIYEEYESNSVIKEIRRFYSEGGALDSRVRALTLLCINPGLDEKICNIEKISSICCISYESLLHYYVESGSDIDKVYELYKNTLRHEMGHIISNQKRYIGKHKEMFYNDLRISDDALSYVKKNYAKYVPKNHGILGSIKYILAYNYILPEERLANEEFGIEPIDVIQNLLNEFDGKLSDSKINKMLDFYKETVKPDMYKFKLESEVC